MSPMDKMTFEQSIVAMLRRRPFLPFTVEFTSGGRIEVHHPEAVALGGGVAVHVSPQGVPTIFDAGSVCDLVGATG